jgi:hypothetical protein
VIDRLAIAQWNGDRFFAALFRRDYFFCQAKQC